MRLIPSPVICFSPSFTHPTPDRIPHLSLCGTMTLWRDHIGGGMSPRRGTQLLRDKWVSSDSTKIEERSTGMADSIPTLFC